MTYFSGHSHTHYSNIRLLDSTIKEDQLINKALELGLAGIAITDHESLSSHLKAQAHLKKLRKAATEENQKQLTDFKLVLGNEVYLVRNGLNKHNYKKGEDKYYHFILLAKDKIGHEQLRKISSMAWKRSYRQYIERVPTYFSDIEEVIGSNPGHVIASTACLGGQFATLTLQAIKDVDKVDEINSFIKWCQSVFKEDFYIEIQPSQQEDQITYNKLAIKYADKHNIKVTLTTDSHYLTREDRTIHKAFLNANDGEREVDAFYSATYMMEWEEMPHWLFYLSEDKIEEIRLNTLEIMNKCEEYSLEHKQVVPRIPVPQAYCEGCRPSTIDYPFINKFFDSPHEDDKYFIKVITQKLFDMGVDKDSVWIKKHLDRIEIECEEIWEVSERIEERLSAYFTTMSKIIDIAWEQSESIVGPGRGSSYVMLICYLLGITQADPLDCPVDLPHWRFLHREKLELPDIDTDFQSTKKDRIISDITKYFETIGGNVVRIATFGTETSKAAIQTACRGLGYEPELGTYLSSLVPIDRGQVRGLRDCFNGNEEKGWDPATNFASEMRSYPDIWAVAQKIEGLISRRGVHAAGILITNQDFTLHNAFMRAPNGVLTSQYELHDSEYLGGLKYDLLVTDALDRVAVTLNLLRLYGYIDWQGSLRKTYDYYLSPDKLDYETLEMWNSAAKGKILNLFQFDTPVGGNAIRSIQPTSLLELGQANSLMRLMPDPGKESPIQEFIKYKENIDLFYDEIDSLTGPKKQKDALIKHLAPLKGVADSQESLMLLVMDSDLTNFTVPEANFLRKTIAKKLTRDVDKLKDFLYKKGAENNVSKSVLDYIWYVQAARQMGYSFSLPHLMAYSTIAIQEMNLVYKYPVIFWNTACLIVDSAGIDEDETFDDEEEAEETASTDDDDNEMEDILEGLLEKPKKKVKNINYGKISSAIGKMLNAGIAISLPEINRSDFTFTPDVERNIVLFGLKGISKINTDLAKDIIKNRPYSSLDDFLNKIKINKIPTINLIKAGAFDSLMGIPREGIMELYLDGICDKKNKLTMANVPMLDKYGLIPTIYDFERRMFNYNRYLKKNKYADYYEIDSLALDFYEQNFSIDYLVCKDGKNYIPQKTWDKIYATKTEKLKSALKNDDSILDSLNGILYREVFDKYAKGSLSKWEMDSVNFYYHTHEMANINFDKYDVRDFSEQPENPIIERIITFKNGTKTPIFELWRIAGTVIDKNKLKHTVTLSTPFGVVDVKIYKPQFAKYDKQISEKQTDGTKKIVERSWFTRGNMLMFTGIRREANFVPKVYKSGKYIHPIQLVEAVGENGDLHFKPMRDD